MKVPVDSKKDSNLGKKMKCVVTDYEGIATARIEYLNGCIQYCVKPKIKEDGKMPDGQYIDVEQLEIIEEKILETSRSNVGGDNKMDAPRST